MDDFKPQQPNEPEQANDKPDDFQAPFDDKPETYVTPTGEPTALETPQPAAPLVMPKKKSGAGKWLLGGLVVLLLAGLGAAAYWQWAEAEAAKKELNSTQSQLEAAQTDLAKAETDKDDSSKELTTPVKTDDALVKEAVAAVIRAQVANKDKKIDVTVKKINSEFAHVTLFEGGEGGTLHYILKKVDDMWVAVYDGIVPPEQGVVSLYGIPADYAKF